MSPKWAKYWSREVYEITKSQCYLSLGTKVTLYLRNDDILIIDYSFDACIVATIDTMKLFNYLGFVNHSSKS